MNEDEIFALLREAHSEPIDPAHYAAVRAKVLSEIQRPRVPWWSLAGLVAAAAALTLVIPMPRPELPPLHAMAAVIPPAPATPVVRRLPKREPLTIKLQTDDPNIVIYWIAY